MKHILLLFAILMVNNYTVAQTIYRGIIQSNKTPLAGATIIAVNGNGNAITKEDGTFEITLSKTQFVKIQYFGYADKELRLKSGINNIELNEELSTLNEVVISASRELQKRKEVPHAISVVSEAKIDETKAIGFDQLINDTPGVYVSSSRASSNEQHFTAARSPISTRPLFLYLEDGLPTRPTAIFNHNTLLERNQIAYNRIEVLRGPAASIYGSDAIGGSFNFITKNPTDELKGGITFEANELGYSSVGLNVGKNITDKFGIYVGTQFNQRNNGPFEHSDYEKFGLTVKAVIKPLESSRLTLTYNGIDFFTDMAGSIGETNFRSRNFQSNQTFTNRDAESTRLRTVWEQSWNSANKTSFSAIYRDNVMIQNPSFRISPERIRGMTTGRTLGEINNNTFESFFGNIQHQIKFKPLKSKLIVGTTVDFTVQDYVAQRIEVTVDEVNRRNTDFRILEDDFILDYEADIYNYAAYAQFELSPINHFKITLGGRYDLFEYDFTERLEGGNALPNQKDDWDNFSPKIGFNYNYSNGGGIYANFSKGFTPPQASTLYRNRRNINRGIEPSDYFNYEIGTYNQINNKLKLDLGLYYLKGENTLITIRDPESDRSFITTNAGETESYGIEYGISYKPIKEIEISHNGSYAKHEYKRFIFNGEDFSNTDREVAPNIIGTSKIRFRPGNGLNFAFEHELIGEYNTSLEGQATNDANEITTTTYSGHNVFNFQAAYRYKKVEVWMHLLNIFDKLYANRVSYNRFRNENSYTVGNPRAFHVGAKYNF